MPLRLAVLASVLVLIAAPVSAQEAPVPLDTLEVTAASRAAGALASATRAVEVIAAADLRRIPARTVADALEWAMGVDVMPRSPALVDLAVRGSSFEQVLVLVDGVRVSDAQTGHFDLTLAVPLDQVERVEIVRGAGSALHGADAVGGVVNVVTRRGGGGGHLRTEAGTWATRGASAGYATVRGGLRADAAAEWRRSDGHRPGTDYETAVGRASLSVPLAGRALRADVGHAARDFGADGFYGAYPSFERTRTTTAAVALHAAPEARLALEPSVSLRRNHDDYVLRRDDPAFYRNEHETWQMGGELAARWRVTDAVRLAGGAEWYRDRLESERLGDRAEDRVGARLEAAAGRVGRAAATAGVRMDRHERYGTVWSPSVSGAWWPTSAVSVRASAGRAFRAPTWTERYYQDPANQGNPDVDPERSWTAEVGAAARLPRGVRLDASVFQRTADGLVDWAKPVSAPSEPWRIRNVVEARFRGVEARAEWDLLAVRWTAGGTWLSVESTAEDGFVSKYALRPLVETAMLGARRDFGSRVQASVLARRARRAGEEAHVRVDARAAYTIGGVRLYADLQNAADERYADITGLDAAGRAFLVGLELTGGR